MTVFKRCHCADRAKCRHRFWFKFKLRGRQYRGSTRTANRQLADHIAAKRRLEALEAKEGWRSQKPVKLSTHVTTYVAHTAKTNRSSGKDRAVLDRFAASVGD